MNHSIFVRDCDLVYAHLTGLRHTLPQDELLARFRALFVVGQAYPEPDILAAIYRIVRSPWANAKFPLFLNRCCYILINYWWSHSNQGMGQGTAKLVELLKAPLILSIADPVVHRLNHLVHQFSQSKWFAGLQDRARAEQEVTQNQTGQKRASASGREDSTAGQRALREDIHRYPFLYSHLLTTWDSSEEGQGVVQKMQQHRERLFEDNLHRYCLALRRHRGSQSGHHTHAYEVPLHQPNSTWDGQWGSSFCNPTLLKADELEQALWQYAGKAHEGRTAQEQASAYCTSLLQAQSFLDAKHQMYGYLRTSVNSKYREHHFALWLETQISETLPQCDRQAPRPQLLLQVCSDLLAALLVNPHQNPKNHVIFTDFNTNLGAASTVGFVMHILLMCREWMRDQWEMLKSYLSGLFAQLFRHYQSLPRHEVQWLMPCLEHLQVAFAVHSNRTDFGWLTR
jgi:hypothetical protein